MSEQDNMPDLSDLQQGEPDPGFTQARAAEWALRMQGYQEAFGEGPVSEDAAFNGPDQAEAIRGVADNPAEEGDRPDNALAQDQRLTDLEGEMQDIKSQQWLPGERNWTVGRVVDIDAGTGMGAIAWQEQFFDNGGYVDFTDGVVSVDGDDFVAKPINPGGPTPNVDDLVLIIKEHDPMNNRIAYRYSGAGGGAYFGFITGNASGGGKYVGVSFATIASGDASGTGDLAVGDIGTLEGSTNCLIFNLAEVGNADGNHYLTATQNTEKFAIYFQGTLLKKNADGTLVILVYMPFAGCGDGFYAGTSPHDFLGGIAVD